MTDLPTLAAEVLGHQESPAMQAALRRIALEFANPNKSAIMAARRTIRAFAEIPLSRAVRCRYVDLAWEAVERRLDLDGTILVLTRKITGHRAENNRAWKYRPRHEMQIAKEARIICRWMRRTQPGLFPWVLSVLADGGIDRLQAAE